jgi:hypothetical protein
MQGARPLGRSRFAIVNVVIVTLALGLSVARAEDRVAQLAKTLQTSSSDKERIAAVAALAHLGDRRTMKPLVAALHDPNPQVRAVAATALGHLGHRGSLPALRAAASDDADENVRARCRAAAAAVAHANNVPDDQKPDAVADEPNRPGFGHQPRAVEGKPELCVVIKSSSDDSPGKADKTTRDTHAQILRQALAESFARTPQVTTVLADAHRWGLDARNLDLSVVKMDVSQAGSFVEVEAQLRLAISDDKGRMLSFLSGGAKVQVPHAKFDAKRLPSLRREALEQAMRGMFDKLLAHLRNTTS